MVQHRLVAAGIAKRKLRKPKTPATIAREPDEWTIRELAENIGMPQATLYFWVQSGRLGHRTMKTGGRLVKLVRANAAKIADLRDARARPAHMKRLPPPDGGGPHNLTT